MQDVSDDATGIPYTVRIKAKIPGYDYGKSTV